MYGFNYLHDLFPGDFPKHVIDLEIKYTVGQKRYSGTNFTKPLT
jgi:hypothetical protein